MASDKVKVAVRVRPFNRRELELSTKCIIAMEDNQTIIHHPNEALGKHPKIFAFDSCFWSFQESDSHYANQDEVFKCLGVDILDNAFQGYNACILAYGQTGSGKSFTMMGGGESKGIIPRLCDQLFERIANTETDCLVYKVEVSYMEIYNEKVRDLLDPHGIKHSLKVREHNIFGPYVDGLSTLAVSSFEQIESLMEEGNKSRTVAATNMNSESSRSHAVFNIKLSQTLTDTESGISGEKVSKISLVDLAGSERAQKTGAVGDRLKEGSNINKSLTTLGLVISALAESSVSVAQKGKPKFVPYRDSVLTWLLKDNLGGNSRTVMIATISPAADNYEESLSTLRYADRAKRIVNHAVVNEDPNAKIIRDLRAEVEALRSQVKDQSQAEDLRDRLAESEKLMARLTQSWEERLSETERIHKERQQNLKEMGISVEASGIKVDKGKYYLVNLNPDPSLAELLVYYLKDRTMIGSADATVAQDIQLSGLGIQPQHAVIAIENNELLVEPINGAKTCVNGSMIHDKTLLKNKDRIVFGNNHVFRVNCPGQDTNHPDQVFDYDLAIKELLQKEFGNDPLTKAVATLEQQHEKDKQAALEKQRVEYEKLLSVLRPSPCTPATPSGDWFRSPQTPFPRIGSDVQKKFRQFMLERQEMYKKSLAKLKEEIVFANGLIREANIMATEMGKQTTFHVTLQIPAANLTPSKIKSGAFVSEPAIIVKRKDKGSQIWTIEKLHNKLIDMRDLYQDWKEKGIIISDEPNNDPFYELQENHNLIGVANVFLEVLFHDVKLDYSVPIISQQGEVAGRLHVEIYRASAGDPDPILESTEVGGEQHYFENDLAETETHPFYGSQMTCRIRIKEATGLPVSLSNFVFCQYSFWNHPDLISVPSIPETGVSETGKVATHGAVHRFDSEKDFTVLVTDEFLEHVQEGALSIEVWGHKCAGFNNHSDRPNSWDVQNLNAVKSRTLQDRWAEVTKRLELWVEIHEINDAGEYVPVEVCRSAEVPAGGIFQLRQGQQRRIVVRLKHVPESGRLPLGIQEIQHMMLGCIVARSRNLQKGLDSYQEEDLNVLRDKWSEALSNRRDYLDEEIQRLMQKQNKNELEVEREQSLIAQWVALTEERNAVLVPTANSRVPGAPADWDPVPAMEKHVPVLFLDMNADDMNQADVTAKELSQPVGLNSFLPKEYGSKMCPLQMLKYDEQEIMAVASWDSSIHEHAALNRVTPETERVYGILQVHIRLSCPTELQVILRKRLCFNIIKRVSFMQKIMHKIARSDHLTSVGVTYEIVSNMPKATEDPEARETLALKAAADDENNSTPADGESYIEKYLKGVSEVESILALDRLRQEVAIKELLTARNKLQPKKSSSLPGFGSSLFHHSTDDGSTPQTDLTRRQRLSLVGRGFSDDRSCRPEPKNPLIVSSLISPVSGSSVKVTPLRRLMNPVAEERSPLPVRADHINPAKKDEPVDSPNEHDAVAVAVVPATAEDKQEDSIGVDDVPVHDVDAAVPESKTSDSLYLLESDILVEGVTSRSVIPSSSSSGYGSHQALSQESINVGSSEGDERLGESLSVSSPAKMTDVNGNSQEGEEQGVEDSVVENGNVSELSLNASALDKLTTSTLSDEFAMDRSTYSDYGVNIESSQMTSMGNSLTVSNEQRFAGSLVSSSSKDSLSESCASSSAISRDLPIGLEVGDSVFVQPNNKPGVVRYLGGTGFAAGNWVGLELIKPHGKHNGTVKGVKYFDCASDKGLFVRPDKITMTTVGETMPTKRMSSGDLRKKTSAYSSQEALASSGGKKGKTQGKMTTSQSNLNSSTTDRLTKNTAASAAKVKK